MKMKSSTGFASAALILGALCAVPAMAQTATGVPNPNTYYGRHHPFVERSDTYFDSHPEEEEALRKHPDLVDNHKWMKNHPDLQAYLASHPGVRHRIKSDPSAFMHREHRYDVSKEHWEQKHHEHE
ncbi:MAG TPA: hypothetical protein VJN94_01420 [Candidatus Binataceae bacterium]|nr:hypothetical protein [Candidatus Binataceae bacterium]